ncbi:hypothetical protein QZH41_008309 [Actinostola sp. cb2023]|nr:hypothetical protein QZH41_008309 [Actinostola sp. cb2023]
MISIAGDGVRHDILFISVCVNITYLPQQYGVSLTLTWNDKVVFNKTISASNPPPICIGVPHVKLLEVCVRLYNISYNKQHFGGCVALEFELLAVKEDIQLGCVYKSQAQVKQDYHELRKNINEMKKTTSNEMKKWEILVSDSFYVDLKKQVTEKIGSLRILFGKMLVDFGEKLQPQKEDRQENNA